MKQQQLTFEKGMTNVPSDAICSDNALEDSTNMIYRDGEHHVIQRPKVFTNATRKLLFVHKLGNGTQNFIYEANNYLYFEGSTINGSYHSTPIVSDRIKALGKTLVVSMDGELHYFLFKNDGYVHIGSNIPRPDMEFGMSGEPGSKINWMSKQSVFNYIGVGSVVGTTHSPDWSISEKETYNNSVIGRYAEGKKKAAQQKAFVLPFFVRYALKLYDGSYTHISNPIPLFPNSTQPCLWLSDYFYIHAMYLVYKNHQTYNDWTDIVKNISIFVSRGCELVDTTIDAVNATHGEYGENRPVRWDTQSGLQDSALIDYHYPFTMYSESERSDNVCSESVFYHLCDLSATEQKTSWSQMKDNFSHATLENIVTQEQLPYDNFYSLAPLDAGFLYDYNNRMNLAHVKRGFFDGFTSYTGIYGQEAFQYNFKIYVRIASESGDRVVVQEIDTPNEIIGHYFFYPDTRANHITVMADDECKIDADLIEHPGLNGAYYWAGWPDVAAPDPWQSGAVAQLDDNDVNTSPEELFNYIITSEVNNPFVYLAHGYNRVGSGYVIGMAAQTQALSQGQFGQYPLIVFTTEGIWAMSLNNTGLFIAIHPMSREVALESNPAITPVDGAIFFVSKKGLMVVEGSKVVCVSEQLKGKGFDSQACFSECFIAYDYRDSLLWIFNHEITPYGGLVYSIKSGTFALVSLSFVPARVVNNYPDYLVQDTTNKVYTLYGRDSAISDTTAYDCIMQSRPMKLENGLALKRIIQIMHIKDLDFASGVNNPGMTFSMKGSNDLKHWCPLTSVRSVPWKYYRFIYDFVGLKATSTFSGTVVVTEEVRTNKLR